MYALSIAATGLNAAEKNLDIVANNIANSQTTAFKRQFNITTDLKYNISTLPGSEVDTYNASPIGKYIGSGTKILGSGTILTEGEPMLTGRSLDIMIKGSGYIGILLPNQIGNKDRAYTRAGNLFLNKNRQITTAEGYLLSDNITIPTDTNSENIIITQDGQVRIKDSDAVIGQITLYTFNNEQGLEPFGSGLFLSSEASGMEMDNTPTENGTGALIQHYLEASNVNTAEEMLNMIQANRLYDLNLKVITIADRMLQATIDLVK